MINRKEKPCKSIGKAKGFEGCGGLTIVRTYGLCGPCYSTWLRTTEEGQEKLYKYAMKHVKEIRKDKKSTKNNKRLGLMSADNYRKTYIQPKFNEIIRNIDYGQNCIATQKPPKKKNAGHRISVGSNRTLALNAHNVFLQSEHSNTYKGGDDTRYRDGLILVFGQEYNDFIEGLKQCPPIKLNKVFYEGLNKLLIDYKKTVEKIKRTPKQRIEERNKLNEYLSIYQKEFLIYANE